MMAITSSGSVAPLAQPTYRRVRPQLRSAQPGIDPMAAARSKDLAAAIKLQIREPYNLGNAFAHYEAMAGT